MNIRRKTRHGAEVPTHSLNDIMFFLLLFFLIIVSITDVTAIKVETPESNSALQLAEKTKNIAITENKEYFFEDKPFKSENLDSVFREIIRLSQVEKKEPLLSVTMDKKLKYVDLAEIMALAQHYKIRLFIKTIKKQ